MTAKAKENLPEFNKSGNIFLHTTMNVKMERLDGDSTEEDFEKRQEN